MGTIEDDVATIQQGEDAVTKYFCNCHAVEFENDEEVCPSCSDEWDVVGDDDGD